MTFKTLLNNITTLFETKKPKTKYSELLGFAEKDSAIYDLAFTSSIELKVKKNIRLNNERLEFLGDAVLETIVSRMLYDFYPEADEGKLSNVRSILVKRSTLNQLGNQLKLYKYMNVKPTATNYNIYGNVFEALVGAVYMDSGFDKAFEFVNRVYHEYVNLDKLLRVERNYKSVLLELCQKHHLKFEYELVEETRIENNKIKFQSRVVVNSKPLGYGVGHTKRASEQAAAKQAVQTLETKIKHNYKNEKVIA